MRRIVVGVVPLDLKGLKHIADADQISGETKTAQLFAGISGVPVIQRAISMPPRFVRTVLPRSDKPVCAVARRLMEERIVSGADRPLQI